jgi:hypothetical protein
MIAEILENSRAIPQMREAIQNTQASAASNPPFGRTGSWLDPTSLNWVVARV